MATRRAKSKLHAESQYEYKIGVRFLSSAPEDERLLKSEDGRDRTWLYSVPPSYTRGCGGRARFFPCGRDQQLSADECTL